MPTIDVQFTSGARTACIIERGALRRLPGLCAAAGLTGTAGLLCDAKLTLLHRDAVFSLRPAFGDPLARPVSEEWKSLAEVEAMCEVLSARGVQRDGFVVAIGGGVLTDLAGLAAALYLRGVPWVSVPTTLLAQVDAGLGGKTGANLRSGKNLVGAFHQPLAVLIDPGVLSTLPEREYRNGLFEVVKYGVIRSPEFFRTLVEETAGVLARQPGLVERIIAECVRIKAEVVTADEREKGVRVILNFGHTAGHALEAETGYSRFRHGEAVAFGMRAAVHLAVRTGRLGDADAARILDAVALYGPIPSLDGVTAEAIVRRAYMDKKTLKGQVRWVLPEKIGQVTVVSGIEEATVRDAIREALG